MQMFTLSNYSVFRQTIKSLGVKIKNQGIVDCTYPPTEVTLFSFNI